MLMRLRNVNMGSNGDMYQNNYFNKNNRSFEGSFRVSMVTYSFDFCFRLFFFFYHNISLSNSLLLYCSPLVTTQHSDSHAYFKV